MDHSSTGLSPLTLYFTVKETPNEDDSFCRCGEKLSLLAVFDGCGGMGGRKYLLLDGQTSAYLGSRLYAETTRDFFMEASAQLAHSGVPDGWAQALENMFRQKAEAFKRDYLDREPSSIVGSMARALPSTAAVALIVSSNSQALSFPAFKSINWIITSVSVPCTSATTRLSMESTASAWGSMRWSARCAMRPHCGFWARTQAFP